MNSSNYVFEIRFLLSLFNKLGIKPPRQKRNHNPYLHQCKSKIRKLPLRGNGFPIQLRAP